MPRTYPDTQAGVNDQEQPRPSYYAVIPAPVRYCKGLPPAAKLLFGEITALCSVEGFCWATNAYFCDLYEVDRSTLQRWLSALVAEGFIRVEAPPGTGSRRIYDLTIRKPTPPQKQGGGAAKMPQGGRKNEAHSITKNNTKSNTTTLNVVGGPPQSQKPEAKEQGEKVSPPAVYLDFDTAAVSVDPISWKVEALGDVLEATGDAKSAKRFRQLLDICDTAGAFSAWQDALDALKHRMRPSAAPVERPGAYFCTLLVSALNERGVAVPVWSPSARRSVKSSIAASLAAAGQEVTE